MNSKQTVCVTWFCVFLLLSCQFTNIDARKQTNTKRTGTGSHVTRTSSSDNNHSNSHADNTRLSYGAPASAPVQHAPVQHASAPVQHAPAPVQSPSAPAAQPVGWNVPQNSGPPPAYQQHAAPPPYQQQAAPPPYQQHGAPPPYQQQGAPPPYQQHGPPPQQYSGAPQQQYPAAQPNPIIIQQQPQSSGGSGLQTALLAGVGGLALYGALKPSGEKVVVINNGESTAATPATTSAATVAAAAPVAAAAATVPAPIAPVPLATTPVAPVADAAVPLAPYPVTPVAVAAVPLAPFPVAADGSVPLAPMPSAVTPVTVFPSDSTTVFAVQPTQGDGNTPLAPYPVVVTMAPPGIPPFSGSSIHYDQIPASSDAPLTSSQPLPYCAPGQNPNDPLVKCIPVTLMYVAPVQEAANTHQAQTALKSSAVPCTLAAINLVIIPILTLLMA